MTHAASAFAFPNLMIEHPWTQKDHARHRERLQTMKPSIDCSVPSSYYVMINRAKKDQQNEEWCARVDRDNELLLSRMAHVMTHHSILADQQAANKQTWHHVSPNEINRKAEQRRIEAENKTILQRLKTKTSSHPASDWKTHAKQFDKHLKEMKARRELSRNPHLIPTSPTTKKTAVRRLKPLKQEQNEWAHDAQGNVIYDRQVEDIDEQQAAVKAEEEEKQAVISSFSFTPDFSSDAERAGPSDLVEHSIPEGAEVEQIYQAGHEIDGRQVIVSMDECNAISSKRATQPSEHDDWASFTAHPPSILHALLIRTYDLDSALHSHLYLPLAPLRSLGKTCAERCAQIIPLLGFNTDNELFFKQSLIKGQKKKTKRAQPKKEAFVQSRINKIEKKIAQEKKQVKSPSNARDEPDAEAEADAEAPTEVQSEVTQSQELDAESAPVNEDDMRPETAEFSVANGAEEKYEADAEQSAGVANVEEPVQAAEDLLKGATQPFTTQMNEQTDNEFVNEQQQSNDEAPAVEAAPAEVAAAVESEPQTTENVTVETAQDNELGADEPAAQTNAVEPAVEANASEPPAEPVSEQLAADSEFESDANATTSQSKPVTPNPASSSAKASPRVPSLSRPTSSHALLNAETSRPSSKSGSKPTTPRLAPLPVTPTPNVSDAPPALDRPMSKASPRLEPLSQAAVSPRADAPIEQSTKASPRTYDNDECDDEVKRSAEATSTEQTVETANTENEQPNAEAQSQQEETPIVEQAVEPQAQEESYEDDTHADAPASVEATATEPADPVSVEQEQSPPEPAQSEPEQSSAPVAEPTEQPEQQEQPAAAAENYADDHPADEPAAVEPVAEVAPVEGAADAPVEATADAPATEDYSAAKEFPDDE